MNGPQGGYLPPSPPHSAGRSSNGTSSMYRVSNGQGGRKYSQAAMEDQLREHHRVLREFLNNGEGDELLNHSTNRARDKLLRLSVIQFQELSTDVFDELLRREDERRIPRDPTNPRNNVPKYLLPKNNFHPKRNQARQKLSTLQMKKFRELSTDVLFELERRYPYFTGGERPPSHSSNAAFGSRGGPLAPIATGRRPSGGSSNMPPYSPGIFDQRSASGGSPNNEFNRPLPKQFHSNTIVPEKGTMIEDDDDSDLDGDFGLDGRSTRRTTNNDYAIQQYTTQISDLEAKLRDMESRLNEKDDALEAERERSTSLTADIEQQLISAKNMNADLQDEVESARHMNSQLQKDVDSAQKRNVELQGELDNLKKSNGNANEWKERYESLEKEFHEQQVLMDEVRQEAVQSLREMKMMSERHGNTTDQEEQLHKQIRDLETEKNSWKSKYTKIRSSHAVTGYGMDAGGAKDGLPNAVQSLAGHIDAQGFIKEVSVSQYQLAMDELLNISKTEKPTAVLDYMRTIVDCVRGVTAEIDLNKTTDETSKRRAKLKSRVSAATNHLITTAKTFASANGLSPVSLLNAAAASLTTAIIDLIKVAKVRPTAEHAEYEEDFA